MMQQALSLQGMRVVCRGHGAVLGRVHRLYLDRAGSRVADIAYRTHWMGGESLVVGTEHVIGIVNHDLSIDAAFAQPSFDAATHGPGLLTLLGARVTTATGKHLGRLADLILGDDWSIADLVLDTRQRLPLHGDRITVGEEILVPEHCARPGEKITTDLLPCFLRAITGSVTSARPRVEPMDGSSAFKASAYVVDAQYEPNTEN